MTYAAAAALYLLCCKKRREIKEVAPGGDSSISGQPGYLFRGEVVRLHAQIRHVAWPQVPLFALAEREGAQNMRGRSRGLDAMDNTLFEVAGRDVGLLAHLHEQFVRGLHTCQHSQNLIIVLFNADNLAS